MRVVSWVVRVGAVLALALVLGAGSAWAQAGTSTIRGTITDPQGAVVPNATVTITNTDTGFTRSQVTSLAGVFSFELIPIGHYRVEVTATGFRKKVMSQVEALVGLATTVDTQLEVGSVTEVVQVEATSTMVQVNTTDATLGNNFVTQQIVQLPMEARNVQTLLTLQPGVTGAPNASGYVAGARSDQSNVTLDGVDINNAQTNALEGTVLPLMSSALEEFRVTTVNANANQGRSSAAQISLVTKSGTNQFRGSAFWYHRSTGFTANDFFNNRAGTGRPKLIRNTRGGAIGGPIVKDKLFFFYAYEGRTDAKESIVLQVVPLPILGQGQMRYVNTNNQVQVLTTAQLNAAFPVVGVNPTAIAALAAAAAAYPANDYTVGDSQANRLMNTAGFRFNAATPVDNNSNVAKIDWTINSNMTFFARLQTVYNLTGQAPAFPDTPAPNTWSHPWGVALSHNWTFASNWVNNFRYGLTRQAFSDQGDSSTNAVYFRFIFLPRNFTRTLSRMTPVHNFVNDTSWIKNSHTMQFGTNIRIVRNSRASFSSAYDTAITNPSFYQNGGTIISDAISAYLIANSLPDLISVSEAQNAATALIGRHTQYTARFTFDRDGTLLASGTPTNRNFATEEYDFYFQDIWKVRKNLTLTYGLRYGVSRPVYETKGFEVKPDISANDYLKNRRIAAYNGVPYDQIITLDLSGPANGKSPLYRWDRNNLQPSVSAAWSPNFEDKPWLKWLFGRAGKSVIRSGFRITNDYYGQALAVLFDLNNTLGFTSNTTISANTYNVTTRPAPLFTGYDQQVRPLPGITIPGNISFPRQTPADNRRRIEGGLDEGLSAPLNYVWNVTIERELPWELVASVGYIGRRGHNLLATRDVMAISNLRDPATGMDWYTAATMLEQIRQTRPPGSTQVATISYFENIFNPSIIGGNLRDLLNAYYGGAYIPAGFNATQSAFWVQRNWYGNDWTTLQDDIDNATGINFFYNPQYGALSAWGTIANSSYHGLALSLRQRLRDLMWDFNYTWSHSLDDASGLQNDVAYGAGFITNPFRQRDNYANSDFDIRHEINVNAVYSLPFGRGKRFASGVGRGVDAIIGGWRLSGIFRWSTGLPVSVPYDDARWATNWNVQSWTTPTRKVEPCITKGDASTSPKLFGCNTTYAYQSFRNAYPGETGSRNVFRLPGYLNLDAGLSKSFTMPWNEQHKLELRWEVFNVANLQRFGDMDTSRTGYGMRLDPLVRNLTPPSNWSNFTGTQKPPGAETAGRIMQVGMRFEF